MSFTTRTGTMFPPNVLTISRTGSRSILTCTPPMEVGSHILLLSLSRYAVKRIGHHP